MTSRRALVALLAPLAVAALAAPAPATARQSPAFATVSVPGTSGFSEPRVSIGPRDARYLTTNDTHGTEAVFRSTDGQHWAPLAVPPGQTAPTTDVDIVTMPTGRILTSELDTAGVNFVTAYSDDKGQTWHQSRFTTYADTDRQWFAVGPHAAGSDQPRVYLLFHNLGSGLAQHNMFVETSTDGGATFGPPIPVTHPGEQAYLDLMCADSGGPSDIFVNQRTGQVYVAFGTRSSAIGGCAAKPVEINVVAANRVWVVTAPAAGTTNPLSWHPSLAVDDSATGKIVGMQLAPGAVDDAGNVFVAYPESTRPYPLYDGAAIKLVHAAGDLSHWSAPTVIAPSGGAGHILPHVVAGDRGKVDLAYYSGAADGNWYSDMSQVTDALAPHPHVVTVRLSPASVEHGSASRLMGACMSGSSATLNGFVCGRSADVYGVALDACGRLLVAFPGQAGTGVTYTAQQTSGPRLRASRCRAL